MGKKVVLALLVVTAIAVYCTMGVYTVRPIGPFPTGVTALVWRQWDEPFFNSLDASCARASSNPVMCRVNGLLHAPINRVIVRFSYQPWAYDLSVAGNK